MSLSPPFLSELFLSANAYPTVPRLVLSNRLLFLTPGLGFSLPTSFSPALASSRMRSDWELACCLLTSPLRFSWDHVHNFYCVYGHVPHFHYLRRRKSRSRHLRIHRMLGDGYKCSILLTSSSPCLHCQ
jgi:hypothetical protein